VAQSAARIRFSGYNNGKISSISLSKGVEMSPSKKTKGTTKTAEVTEDAPVFHC
jgi:hypothetical protein